MKRSQRKFIQKLDLIKNPERTLHENDKIIRHDGHHSRLATMVLNPVRKRKTNA